MQINSKLAFIKHLILRYHPIYILLSVFFQTYMLNAAEEKNTLQMHTFLSVADGLSQANVTCIVQDSFGLLWIGTCDGLNMYDGYSFRVFRNNPEDTLTISDNYIRALSLDEQQNLWIATNKGLNKFSRKTFTFSRYTMFSVKGNYDKKIYGVYCDKKGFVWIKTLEELVRLNSTTKTIDIYKHYNNPFTYADNRSVCPIMEDNKGRLWIGTKDGITFFDREIELFKRFILPSGNGNVKNEPLCFLQDAGSTIWAGTTDGLYKYNAQRNIFEAFPLLNNSFNRVTIYTIHEYAKDELWLGTNMGIVVLKPDSREIKVFHDMMLNSRNYPITPVHALYKDASDVLWIGTLQGIWKKDTKPEKFKTYKSTITIGRLTVGDIPVSAMCVDDSISLWIGTWGYGISKFFLDKDEFVPFVPKNQSMISLANDYISVLYKDSRNLIWIGTSNGVYVIDNREHTSPICLFDSVVPCNAFRYNRINHIYEDRQKNIWFATNAGLHRYNPETGFFRQINKLYYIDREIALREVYVLQEDEQGVLWLGTDEGVLKYHPQKGSCEKILKGEEEKTEEGLSSNIIYSFYLTDSLLWIGTGYGLNCLEKKSGKIYYFSEKKDLHGRIIYSIVPDNNNNLWLGTDNGLVFVDVVSGTTMSFNKYDGLQSEEFFKGSALKSFSGEIFFGGSQGMNSFYPDSIRYNDRVPNICINAIEFVGLQGVRTQFVFNPAKIVIPVDVKMFTLYFSALDFSVPGKNAYQYQLFSVGGSDDEWIDIGTKNYISFSNIMPGTYFFKIRGSNNDLVWNEQGVTMEIQVNTHVWKSKEALYVYIVVFFLLVFVYINYRTKSLRQINKILREKEIASVEVAKQKEQLAIKNKDLTDSIHYAKRIQDAMMPSQELFTKFFKDSFVLFRPKHIVSGDFFWISSYNDKVYVAAVDCTGHGVPGAFMSLIGIELLRRTTNIRGIDQPARILNILNASFADMFKDMKDMTIKDGMDLALCVYDSKKRILDFAGAFNSIFIVRNNKIMEFKGDRLSVGIEKKDPTSGGAQGFTNHHIALEENDQIYLFTDGYIDQFGGPDIKKYKKRRFSHLLLNIHKYGMDRQKDLLIESFDEWRGNNEQVDDVLVIGFKP